MHIHILGICGTFMGSLAQLGKQAGMRVTGCDANVYPPMSTQLEQAGIELIEGFSSDQLSLEPDLWVVGNAISRGNTLMEAIIDRGDPYVSGPEFLAQQVLPKRHVIAISGTHGKTSTSSMVAHILEYAELKPGFLIGGVPANFGESARLGSGKFFVVEADEYDTAFFDKRSKFVHYRPRTLVINNLEFDHADIFENLAAIQKQFHHLVRTVPEKGSIFFPMSNLAIDELLDMGCWSKRFRLAYGESRAAKSANWNARAAKADFSSFDLYQAGQLVGNLDWQLIGEHNMQNALSAVAAAVDVGIEPSVAIEALNVFKGVKRRLEVVGQSQNISLYDDFAHHPTAIASTLEGLRAKVGDERIVAVIEPRSFTMKQGTHRHILGDSVAMADKAIWFQPQDISLSLTDALPKNNKVFAELDGILDAVTVEARTNEKLHIVVMSNGGFAGIHKKLIARLALHAPL